MSELINRAAVRRLILETAARTRPGWRCTRASQAALDAINARLRAMVAKMVHSHPSGCGQTFRL